MALRDIAELPGSGRIAVDTAPIIYVLEGHPEFGARYAELFDFGDLEDLAERVPVYG